MIIDSRNEFCDATALNTGAAGTYLIGSQVDLDIAAGGLGFSDQPYLVVTVDTGIKAAAAGTVQFVLASDAAAAIATDGSATELWRSKALVTSTTSDSGALKAGTVLAVLKLPIMPEAEEFLGILQVTGTSAITAGKINAFITFDPAVIKHYADAVN